MIQMLSSWRRPLPPAWCWWVSTPISGSTSSSGGCSLSISRWPNSRRWARWWVSPSATTPGSSARPFSASYSRSLAAALFALTRVRVEKLPQEAIIGITFVVASAATILVADRAPEGAEHIKETLSGALLWVTWPTVFKVAVIYAAIGLFHWILRERFLLISVDPDEAFRRGWNVRWWDFLFYLSFGVMITFSVGIGGILMVFAYLVIPACVAILLHAGMRARLAVGWMVGVVGSALGLVGSYYLDMPTGPAVVVVLGLMLVAAGLFELFEQPSCGAGGDQRSRSASRRRLLVQSL